MTIVDRETRCFLAIQAVFQRSKEVGQEMLNQAPAEQYFSDMFPMYESLSYRKGYHLSLADKSETFEQIERMVVSRIVSEPAIRLPGLPSAQQPSESDAAAD